MKYSFLVAGPTGAGKSTICNLIHNRSSEVEALSKPFNVSDDFCCINRKNWIVESNENCLLIDANGTCEEVSSLISKQMNIKPIDYVLFVVKKDRLDYFSWFSEVGCMPRSVHTPIIIFTNCENGWVKKQKSDVLNKILEMVENRYIELNLSFLASDEHDDIYSLMISTKRKRQVEAFLDKFDELIRKDHDVQVKNKSF